MNIQEYIASGILELYVLDQLSPAERRGVEDMVKKYPELKSELNKIEEALFAFSNVTATTPRAGLEKEIIEKVLSQDKNPNPPAKNNNQNLGLILGIIGLLAAGILGWLFMQANSEKEKAIEEKQAIIVDCENKDEQIFLLERMIDQMLFEGSQLIQMKGTEKQPDSYANIVYNTDQKQTLLETANLPAPIAGKQYQLWAIVDGTPVDLGVFDIDENAGFLEMRFVENAQAFAVTLEPTGGSTAPTLEEMWVIGNRTS